MYLKGALVRDIKGTQTNMSWNGDSKTFDFVVKAADKAYIERFAELVRGHFPEALPPKKLKIEEKPLLKKVIYYQMKFSFDYGFFEIFDHDLEHEFSEFFVLSELLPNFEIRIEMAIERSNTNHHTFNTRVENFYVCSTLS